MVAIRVKRGTRAQLDAAATAGTLAAGEPYLVTDAGSLAVGTSTTAYAITGPTAVRFTKADGSETWMPSTASGSASIVEQSPTKAYFQAGW